MTEAPVCFVDVVCVLLLGRDVKNSKSNLYLAMPFMTIFFQ